MKTALILLSILGMACAFSMKNFHRRVKAEDSEENGVFKYRPRYFLYKHAYFYPPLKRLPAQGGSDSSEENGDGDSSDEGGEEENSNEEENAEGSEGNEEEEAEAAEAENSTLSSVTPLYGTEATPEAETIGLAALQLPKKAGDAESKAAKKKESDEEEEEEEEENENEEAEVEENEQVVNGTSTNSTEVYSVSGGSVGDNGEEGEGQSVTEAGVEGATTGREPISDGPTTAVLPKALRRTTPPPEAYGTSSPPLSKTTAEYWGEYEQTGNNENDSDYQVYDNENGEPRGDNYRAYEDEYSYYKGRGYEGYDGQDYYYHQ